MKKRKTDFRQYLGQYLTQRKAEAQQREAIENGEDLENLSAEGASVSEGEIDTHIKHLRNDEQHLHRLIAQYLDLPREEGSQSSGGLSPQYDEEGPPTTHPSAGLSYLRTKSHIYNHPELGPQENHAPVQGRVVVAQRTGDRMNTQALIGMAGVVAKDNRKTFFKERGDNSQQGLSHYDPDIPGGGKLWTHPERASVNSHGRIHLGLDRADKNALNVAMGIHSEGPKYPEAALAAEQDREFPDLASSRPRDSERNLGYGLEGMASTQSSRRATPFLGPDDEAPNDALGELLRLGSLKPKT